MSGVCWADVQESIDIEEDEKEDLVEVSNCNYNGAC